jgi:hypothetical protein
VGWARSKGINPAIFSGQLKMAAQEYKTDYRRRLGPAIERATTPEEITRAMDPYEAYAGYLQHGRPVGAAGTARALKAIHQVAPPVKTPPTPAKSEEPIGQNKKRMDKLSMTNWENSQKQTTLVLRNVPGANVYAMAAGMAAVT